MKKLFFIGCFFCIAIYQLVAVSKFTNQDLEDRLKDLERTDKIIIFYNGKRNHHQIELKGQDVKEFLSLLKLEIPPKLYYCRCPGTLVITFYSNNQSIGRLTYHHSLSVRASFVPLHSNTDIVKEYREKLKAFLLKHGIKAEKLK